MICIFCPKCGGGTFIADEELVKVLENSRPLKAIIRVIYACRACSEKFGRLIHDTIENRKMDVSGVTKMTAYSDTAPTQAKTEPSSSESTEGLRFF